VAIRCSAHPIASGLARLFGFPLTATSANRSGASPSRSPREALSSLALSGRVALLDGGETAGGAPSTIVDPAADPPDVLREGAIASGAIERCLLGERA
jgi:L-threonylcarbamoyladenylate synthase